jgi:hypothetical protein
MSGGHTRYGKVCAGRAHGIAQAISVDVADRVIVAVDEQPRLRQEAAIGRLACVGDIGVIVQVPRTGGVEAMTLERPCQHVEVRRWLESGVGLSRGGAMGGAEASSVARDRR